MNSLAGLADAMLDFAAAAGVMALFSALTVQALFDLVGYRKVIQRRWVEKWLEARAWTLRRMFEPGPKIPEVRLPTPNHPMLAEELAALTNSSRVLFALPQDKLCGQIAVALQGALEKAPSFVVGLFAVGAGEDELTNYFRKTEPTSSEERAETISYQVERGLDDLLAVLDANARRVSYNASLSVCFLISAVLVITDNAFHASAEGMLLAAVVAVAAGLVSPLLRRWIEHRVVAD